MAGEIGAVTSVAPVVAPSNVVRAAAVAAVTTEVLTLLQPAENLLPAGQSAPAQVLDLQQLSDQSFQLLLKLTTGGGLTSTLQASSSQPIMPGATITVTQLTANSLAITLQQLAGENIKTLTSIDTEQVPPGSLVQGKVLSSTLLPTNGGTQPLVYRAQVSLLNTALAGSTLSIDSPQPLKAGSLLTAVVNSNQSLSFVPLQGRLDQLAVGQQLQTQQSRQGSLEGLISALQNLPSATGTNATPTPLGDQLRASVATLLAGLPDLQTLSDPKAVAKALANSGVFLEAKMLGGQNPTTTPDLKANLLRLVATLLPELPSTNSFNSSSAANAMAQALPFVRSALGILDQVGKRPVPDGFPLPARLLQNMENTSDLETLLRLSAAAISRLQSHQLSGLEQTRTHADGMLQTTWQTEIPMRNLQDIVPMQVRIQREETSRKRRPNGHGKDEQDNPNLQDFLWRVELAFDLAPLGPLQIQAQLLRGSLSSQLWAERPSTAKLVDDELGNLRERLIAAGLTVGDLQCHQGVPPQGPQTKIEQRWVDETA